MTQGYVPSRRFPDAPPLSPDNPGRLVPAILGQLPGALPGRAGSPSAAAAPSAMKLARETVPASTALVGALVNGLPFGNQTPPPGMMVAPAAAIPAAPITPPAGAPVTPPAAVVAPPPIVAPPAFVAPPAEANGADPAPPPRIPTPPPGMVGGLSTGGANGQAAPLATPAMGVEPMKPAFIGEPEPPPRVGPIVGAPTNEEAPPSSGSSAAVAAPQAEVSPWMREVGQPASAYKPEPAPEPAAQPVPLSPVSRAEPRTSSSRLPIVLIAVAVVAIAGGVAAYLVVGQSKRPDKTVVTATPGSTSTPPAGPTAAPSPETAQSGGTEAPAPTATTAPAPTGETLKSPPPPPPQPGVGVGRPPPTKPTAPPAGGQKFDPSGI
jgi:hypothetical protein